MKTVNKLLNLYLDKKLKNETLIFILNFLIMLVSFIAITIFIENTAYFTPTIKKKILTIIVIIICSIFAFLSLKIIIHKYNFWNNSTKQKLAKELIEKVSVKDRILNVLQIYSETDPSNPYSDLTLKAIDDLENELNDLDIKKNYFKKPLKKIYFLLSIITTLIIFLLISDSFNNAIYRLVNYNKSYIKPLPFNLSFNTLNKIDLFKYDMLELNIS